MKKTVVIVVAIFMAFAMQATAQMEKGTFFCGMSSAYSMPMWKTNILSLGYARQTRYDFLMQEHVTETWSFNVFPKVGYFVVQNLAIGLNGCFKYTSTNSLSPFLKCKYHTWGVGPFIRYYVKSKKVLPVVELGIDYWNNHFNSQYGSYDTLSVYSMRQSVGDEPWICYNIGAGIAIPLAQKVSFDLFLTYSALRGKWYMDDRIYDAGRNIISVRFGFVFLINKPSSSNKNITN